MIVNPRGRKDALTDRTPIGSANFHGAVGVASEDDIHGQSKGESHLVKVIPDDGVGSDMHKWTEDFFAAHETATLQVIADAINKYGSGQHPYAEPENLDSFQEDYRLACMTIHLECTKDEEPHMLIRGWKKALRDVIGEHTDYLASHMESVHTFYKPFNRKGGTKI